MKIGQIHTAAGVVAVAHTPEGTRHLKGRADMRTILESDQDLQELILEDFVDEADAARQAPPVLPGAIIAVGLNYRDHIRETGLETPSTPLLFAKLPNTVIGPGAGIRFDPAVTGQVDWEGELAVVIGKRCWQVDQADALSHIAGYTVANDVSARDLQFADGQWLRGKSLATFCPLGPILVTPDEVPDPQALALTTRVNGETVQSSSTSEMIFAVDELIAFCSRHFVLEPGYVLLTGTPWGCGGFASPPRFLSPGDVVEVEVSSIGTLVNPVVGVDQ
ncbi:fumarylacetoacetate hydrolase family protein [Aeromicrobium panaciterrae]|uniref:fumarylacetoacetate hydrolase family protein n=1 Tax=Aeromicrobium panaciterrae TaxID=363861 RepID=UPI0031CFD415